MGSASRSVRRSATKLSKRSGRLSDDWTLHERSDKSLDDLARMFNAHIRGWINYYGRFYKSALYPTLRHIDRILARWAHRKFKSLQRHKRQITALAGAHRAPPAGSVRSLVSSAWTRPNNGSRMRRESHVRFCESAGVKLPRATHLVVGFEHEGDARRFLDAMHDRLGEFALSLHPDKTRLIEFGRFAANDRKLRGLGKPETFAFLGFTFICGRSRRGNFQLQRKTRRDRMRRKLGDIKAELLRRMHQPIPEQGKWLRQVVAGHFAYYAVPTNSRALSAFRHYVTDLWRRTLRRRSQKDGFTWERMTKLVTHWLPPPRILHPWPDDRFDVRHPR